MNYCDGVGDAQLWSRRWEMPKSPLKGPCFEETVAVEKRNQGKTISQVLTLILVHHAMWIREGLNICYIHCFQLCAWFWDSIPSQAPSSFICRLLLATNCSMLLTRLFHLSHHTVSLRETVNGRQVSDLPKNAHLSRTQLPSSICLIAAWCVGTKETH